MSVSFSRHSCHRHKHRHSCCNGLLFVKANPVFCKKERVLFWNRAESEYFPLYLYMGFSVITLILGLISILDEEGALWDRIKIS